MRKQRIRGAFAAAIALSFVAVACGSDSKSASDTTNGRHCSTRGHDGPCCDGSPCRYSGSGRDLGAGHRSGVHHPDAGEVAIAMGHAGSVRRILRGGRSGLLQGSVPRRDDPRRRCRHRSADRPGQRRRRLRDRVGAQGTCQSRGWSQHRRHRSGVPTIGNAAGQLQGQGHHVSADFAGKKIGNWGFGNEFEVFAAMTKAGIDPASVDNVAQQFDMVGLLEGDIDAAEAMTYNEYAQSAQEAINPGHRQALHARRLQRDLVRRVEGVGMLQDAIWADGTRLSDPAYNDMAVKFVAASLQGWAYCRDNGDACAQLVTSKNSILGLTHQKWQMNEINKLIWPAMVVSVRSIPRHGIAPRSCRRRRRTRRWHGVDEGS